MTEQPALVLVSNRGPVTYQEDGSVKRGTGGLVTALTGLASHRELIVRELCAVYHPSCNEQQFDNAWEDHWIGEYTAPTTGPLNTGRQPGTARHETDGG